ncbi:hypothetical protein D917_10544 [Trichinella nativa]|uniref:Uncharacterized protein n=1 Tax=Trichinella nativa TaxID=6335 RepID=A0A1Y3EA19_9BILA|nr:hypothetical protein D917_10544 [Trichinella nativa]
MTGQLPPVAAKQTLEAFESCDAGVGLFLGTVDRLALGSSCRITARCKKLHGWQHHLSSYTWDKRSNSSSESGSTTICLTVCPDFVCQKTLSRISFVENVHRVVPLDAGLDRTISTGSVFITQDNSIYIHNDGHSRPTTLRYQLTFTRPSLQR